MAWLVWTEAHLPAECVDTCRSDQLLNPPTGLDSLDISVSPSGMGCLASTRLKLLAGWDFWSEQ